MIFVLSKILTFLISPITWIIFFLAFGLFTKSIRKKTRSYKLGFIALLVFSNPFLLSETFRLWEKPFYANHLKEQYDYGILLGGIADFDEEINRPVFNKSSDRLLQTLKLYEDGIIDKVIISSGSGYVLKQEIKEADFLKEYLISIGIPEDDLIIENRSKNTHENAVFTKKILTNGIENNSFLLITSAYHMRRAAGCFAKEGFRFDMFSTDKKTRKRSFLPDALIIPSVDALFYWNLLVHEITGFLVYKILNFT